MKIATARIILYIAILYSTNLSHTTEKIAIIMASSYCNPSSSTIDRIKSAAISITSTSKYAKKWGYKLYVYENPPPKFPYPWFSCNHNKTLGPGWNKISLCLYIMEKKEYTWIAWIDDDIIITRPDIPFELFIEKYKDKDFIVSKDPGHQYYSPTKVFFNTGIFLLKNSDWSIHFFKEIYDARYFFSPQNTFYEQDTMTKIYWDHTDREQHSIVLPVPELQAFVNKCDNCCPCWQDGNFAIHYSGIPAKERVQLMNNMIKNLYQ